MIPVVMRCQQVTRTVVEYYEKVFPHVAKPYFITLPGELLQGQQDPGQLVVTDQLVAVFTSVGETRTREEPGTGVMFGGMCCAFSEASVPEMITMLTTRTPDDALLFYVGETGAQVMVPAGEAAGDDEMLPSAEGFGPTRIRMSATLLGLVDTLREEFERYHPQMRRPLLLNLPVQLMPDGCMPFIPHQLGKDDEDVMIFLPFEQEFNSEGKQIVRLYVTLWPRPGDKAEEILNHSVLVPVNLTELTQILELENTPATEIH